jgi:hypothetical protein
MDDKAHSAEYFENASFAYFNMQGTVTVWMANSCSSGDR